MEKWLEIVKSNQWNLVKELVTNKIPHKLVIAWDTRYEGISDEIVKEVSELNSSPIPIILLDISGGTLDYAKIEDDKLSIGTIFGEDACEFSLTENDIVEVYIGNSVFSKGIIEVKKEEVVNRKLKLKLVRRNKDEE